MHLVRANPLGGQSLPRNSVIRLTDSPVMTMDIKQQNNNNQAQCPKSVNVLVNLKTVSCPADLYPMDGLQQNSE